MLKLLNRNTVVQVLFIMAALGLLWGPSLITPPPMSAVEGGGVLYILTTMWLSRVPLLAVVLAMVLVLVEGVALNLLLAQRGLVSQNSLLPTLLYVIFMGTGITTLTPIVLVNGVLIVCTSQLMLRGTLLTISTEKICSVTALIGLCSMFYLPSMAYLLSYLLIAISYRLYSWRDWAALLLGILSSYIVLFTTLYLTDNLSAWWAETHAELSGIHFRTRDVDALTLAANIVLTLVIMAAIIASWQRLGEKPVVWQKNASTVMLFVIGGLVMLLYSWLLPVDITLFALPAAFCSTLLLMPERMHSRGSQPKGWRRWIYDILLILIFVAALLC